MLVAMADESGVHADSNYFGIVAYIAHHKHWIEFNSEWREALKKHGIPHFHMWEFAGKRKTFKGWDEARRRALMHDLLMAIMSGPMTAVGSMMHTKHFRQLSEHHRDAYIGPYMMCFYEVTFGIGISGQDAFVGQGVDFIYSEQDEFAARFRQYWNFAKKNKDFGRNLGVLEFHDMRQEPGLQAADLLAWEFRHFYHLRDTRPDLGLRLPFDHLLEHQAWNNTKRLKYLPGWYIDFQVNQILRPAMNIFNRDPELWGHMYEELSPPKMGLRRDFARMRVMDKYVKYPEDRHGHVEDSLYPPPRMAGGILV
jgi:hypothetical protein